MRREYANAAVLTNWQKMFAIPGDQYVNLSRNGAAENQIIVWISGKACNLPGWRRLEIRCHVVEQGKGFLQTFSIEAEFVHKHAGQLDQ